MPGTSNKRPNRAGKKGPAGKGPWSPKGIALAGGVVAAGLVVLGMVRAGTGQAPAGVVYSGNATTTLPSSPSASSAAAQPASAEASGGGYRLTSVTGQRLAFPAGRPTLLYFMSASCSSCWQGASQIAQIYPKLSAEARVISFDVTPQVDTPAQVEQMVQSTGAQWPQAFATTSILTRYRIAYLDTAVVLSPTGKVVYDGAIPSNTRLMALVQEAAVGKPA